MTESNDEPGTRAVLEARAQRLAIRAAETASRPAIALLRFTIGEERYAIEARFVRRIAVVTSITPVPDVPHFFAGIANLDGEIVPLVNISAFLGGPGDLTNASRAVVLGRDRVEFALLADSAESVEVLRGDDGIQHLRSPGDSESIRGILPNADVILDGASLLNDPRLTVGHGIASQDTSQEKHI